jgi:hypothetical protein
VWAVYARKYLVLVLAVWGQRWDKQKLRMCRSILLVSLKRRDSTTHAHPCLPSACCTAPTFLPWQVRSCGGCARTRSQ